MFVPRMRLCLPLPLNCCRRGRFAADGHDVVRVADRMTDVVVQELSGQQRTLHGRTTTVTVLGKPKVCHAYGILLID